ncbi:MAG: transporter substrate-binding domain-containing protein, partial [Candidatus Delongbacteria bacterium]|nr:transporter substrate-binding domain-containing protein [Candidatus Delongbacteria bacterium]
TRLVIVGDAAYPSFSFFDENGNPAGQNVEISYAIARDMGMDIELKLGKWSEILENFKNGKYDAVQNILYSETRAKYLDFSIPFAVSSYKIFARKGTPIPDTIEELKGKKIIVEKSDVMHDVLEKAGLGEYLLYADSHENALKMLSEGEGDYAPLSYLTAIYYIKQNKIENISFGESNIRNAEFCYAVRKGDIMLLNNIDNSITNIKASGEYRDIYIKWFGEDEVHPDYRRFIKYAVAILIAFLILISGFIVWNKQLKKQVDKKTSELKDEIETRRIAEELLISSEKELKEKNIQLAESEEKYRQIYDSASEGIFMTRPDGTILSANPEACRILGRAEKEITELGRDKLFDIKDPRFIESLEIRKRKGSFRGEITAIDKDGTRIPLMLTSNIYRDSDGEEKTITIFSDISDRKEDENKLRSYLNEMEKNKAAMLNILKDVNREVTERKSAQEELKKLNTELEEKVKERTARLEKQNRELTAAQDSLMLLLEDVNETRKELTLANSKLTAANKELEAFSYSVSHDLRSPLRAIIGFSNILKEDYCKGLSEEGARYLSKIIDNTLRMQDLIDDLLEFSRVGRSQIRPVRIRTAELLKKIFEEITEGEKSRTFNFSLDEGIPDITADRVLVTQMFQNIIGNAVKFTSKKEIAEIKINYENDGEFHIISIKDNGAGFDEKYKNKIFEVFQRLHSSDEFPGTGVGMSIVAKVASKHGWVLDAESKNLNGAAFYIKIPLEGKKEVKVEQRV